MALLPRIQDPADLRALPAEQLDDLAAEIREFIVNAVSNTGGHLGSNLGAVELSIALHRVFESPQDPILWDTGHQAYVHKILTGRQEGFSRLRQTEGISGYPSREESRHDFIENSHASTVLSYAHGLAMARDRDLETKGSSDHRHIVAVIGDGSMTGGMAYEALNNLGHGNQRVIIVLNDNGRSYAPTISNLTTVGKATEKLSRGLTNIRMNPVYVRRQRKLESFLRDLPVVGRQAEQAAEAFKAAVREFLQPPAFFEALGVHYIGPVDGHDIEELEHAFRSAIERGDSGPIVVHVLTQKGRGYSFAEDDDEKHLHDTPTFNPATGPTGSGPSGYTQAFSEALIKSAEHDER
ncbi:MAG: 1-deoxy-D-xylulose-5-phosphate synthase N-terminal domain-containing protein, partial [Actinomycetota bacterium]